MQLEHLFLALALCSVAACGGSSETGASGAGGEGGAGSGSSSSGASTEDPCGGCPEGELCRFVDPGRESPNFRCGGDRVCQPKPEIPCTTDPPRPYCGCDGQVHASECAAYDAGQDVGPAGCEPPEGYFPCGGAFCRKGSEICLHEDVDGFPPSSYDVCEPLPEGCDAGDCDCILGAAECVGSKAGCSGDEASGVTVRCGPR